MLTSQFIQLHTKYAYTLFNTLQTTYYERLKLAQLKQLLLFLEILKASANENKVFSKCILTKLYQNSLNDGPYKPKVIDPMPTLPTLELVHPQMS